jgi:hypothetical protein
VSNEFLANDESKTREQLIAELVHLRRQIAELESTNYAKLSVSEIFREFADHLPVVIWCIQPNLPQIEYVSAAYESVWGRTCASLYAEFQTFIEAIHPRSLRKNLN